jgi:hypothetical protein
VFKITLTAQKINPAGGFEEKALSSKTCNNNNRLDGNESLVGRANET